MTPLPAPGADRPLLGIGLMVLFCILAPLADSMAKLLGDRVPLVLLLVIRFGFQVALLLPIALAGRQALIWPLPVVRLVALRAGLHVLGIGAMFLSLRYMPLADAIAIAYVMPFLLLILGHFLMGEEVGWRRIAACGVGFAGCLMVIQPSFAAVGAPALLPLFVAVVFAAFMILTRRIARDTEPVALQVTGGAIALLFLLPLVAAGHGLDMPDLSLARPGALDWTPLALLGILGTLSHLVLTWSLRFAPASTVAPMQYLEIPMAAVIGWLIFRDFPNGLALAGILVTIAAGLYIVARESALSRR